MKHLKLNKYYMDLPEDGLWTRMQNRLTRRPVPDFPRTLQIQTFTGCNADCIFCPYGETYTTQPRGRMTADLYRRVVDEAARHKVRRISPYLMNEPLMDKDLLDKVRYINERIPDAKVVVTSNGHFLTPEMTDRILAMGEGIHKLYISFQGIDKDSYEKTMRGNMDFDRTMQNVNHFVDTQRARGLTRPELWITMVDTEVIDAKKAVAYWRGRGVAAKYTTLENRGGNIKDADSFSHSHAMTYFSTCTRLFKQAYIMFNGDMVLCCVDYSRKEVLGNITDSSIEAVWNGERAREIRRRFLAHEFDRLPLCGDCRIDEVREVSIDARGRETVTESLDD
ncbi:MAG TPA: radical SAM protein [Dongiaceae bacterium]|nr:radical SAM protein [Dongiaceae bacterium]